MTGFKWMANRAYDLEKSGEGIVLLAYEEAIGFMCGTQVRLTRVNFLLVDLFVGTPFL